MTTRQRRGAGRVAGPADEETTTVENKMNELAQDAVAGKAWIRLAEDALGRPLFSAMSLGEHGRIFAGMAYPVPREFLDELGDKIKYFTIVEEGDVTDEEKEAFERGYLLTQQHREAAARAQAARKLARKRAEIENSTAL